MFSHRDRTCSRDLQSFDTGLPETPVKGNALRVEALFFEEGWSNFQEDFQEDSNSRPAVEQESLLRLNRCVRRYLDVENILRDGLVVFDVAIDRGAHIAGRL